MKVLQKIIDNIEADAPVREVIRGRRWNAVVSRCCGLASTLGASCSDESQEKILRASSQTTARELSQLSFSEDIPEASLGIAAINSLIEIDESLCVEVNAGNLLLKMVGGRNISIVGHFPFVDTLREAAENLWVIEKRLQPGDHGEDEAEYLLARSDIIAISGTTLINHTLESLLSLCPENSVKMLLGPTTPMSHVLFDYGIDIISGSRVIDQETALKAVAEGATFRQLKRTGSIRLVSMVRDISLFKEVIER